MNFYNGNGIVTLGISGLPLLKSAPVNKALFINKALKEAGFQVLILNDEAILSECNKEDALKGTFMGVDYEYTTSSMYIKGNILTRRFYFCCSKLKKWYKLIKLRRVGYNKILFFTDGSILKLITVGLFSKLFNYKVILVYHELRSEFKPRQSRLKYRINDRIFDKWCFKFVDAILPISEFLIKRLSDIGSKKPILKIPPLCDVQEYPTGKVKVEPSFLFCGSLGRADIMEFVINAFEGLNKDLNARLLLVVFGSSAEKERLKIRVNESDKCNSIVVYSELEFTHLLRLYSTSLALLIPLKNDLRDIARFPQKISEYALSGRPIICTNFGEVRHYFKDNVNAFVIDEFNVKLFSEKMNYVILNQQHADKVGALGKEDGIKYFDYRSYSKPLGEFLNLI